MDIPWKDTYTSLNVQFKIQHYAFRENALKYDSLHSSNQASFFLNLYIFLQTIFYLNSNAAMVR